eukprot:1191539-Prorocentrum_minimum.AAC.1
MGTCIVVESHVGVHVMGVHRERHPTAIEPAPIRAFLLLYVRRLQSVRVLCWLATKVKKTKQKREAAPETSEQVEQRAHLTSQLEAFAAAADECGPNLFWDRSLGHVGQVDGSGSTGPGHWVRVRGSGPTGRGH